MFLEKTAISKIESGKRPVNDIELIAIVDALKVSVNWLLGLEQDIEKKITTLLRP